jgi:hypothetical protein
VLGQRKVHTQGEEKDMWNGGIDWSDATTSQVMLTATCFWKKQRTDSSLESLEKAQPYWYFNFNPLMLISGSSPQIFSVISVIYFLNVTMYNNNIIKIIKLNLNLKKKAKQTNKQKNRRRVQRTKSL